MGSGLGPSRVEILTSLVTEGLRSDCEHYPGDSNHAVGRWNEGRANLSVDLADADLNDISVRVERRVEVSFELDRYLVQ